MGSGGKIAAIFILSLFASTFFISYFDTALNGSTEVKTIDLPTSISGMTVTDSFLNSDCLTNLKRYDIVSGSYSCSVNGLDLFYGVLRNKQRTDIMQSGDFKNAYSIKYINGTSYYILVAEQATPIPTEIIINIDKGGIHIPNVFLGIISTNDLWFYPITGINNIDATILTEYNGKDNTLSINFNGAQYDIPSQNLPTFYGNQLQYYEGVATFGGYTLVSISSSYLSSDSIMNGLSMVIGLLWKMLLLAGYSFPYEVIPLEFQVLLILPQEFLIVVGIAMFIREG
jgi:hypothetical protein